jgi:heptosyltransferase-2
MKFQISVQQRKVRDSIAAREAVRESPMKVGVFLPNWVGDVVMATPALRALRRHFGKDATLIGIMKPHVGDVLAGTSWLNEVWSYDDQADDPGIRWRAVVHRMYRAKFDIVVLLVNSFLPALMTWLARSRERVGYVRYRRGYLLTLKLYPPSKNGEWIPYPTLDYYLQLVYLLGASKESPKMELATTSEDELTADQVWKSLGLRADGRVVALNSSGAFGAAKLWPDEYFGELARRIVTALENDVLILCGPQERERAAKIAQISGSPRVFTLAEQRTSIGLSKACVRRSRLLVTTDSGPRHFAAAFDVPVISLFGPTHITWSDTHYDKEIRLQIPVDCGPCQQRTCPLVHHRCMRDLSVEQVYQAVHRALTAAPSQTYG